MKRLSTIFTAAMVAILIAGSFAQAAPLGRETIDPEIAKTDADFLTQGEYVGEVKLDDGKTEKVGAQVIARSGGKFDIVLYRGGLPGDGWTREDSSMKMTAERDGDTVKLIHDDFEGTIGDGKMIVENNEGRAEMKRVERKSPTLGAKAPEGAIVVLGEDLDLGNIVEDIESHKTDMGTVTSGFTAKPLFEGDSTIHVEFRLSYMPTASGQARSNSGVYLHDAYECQVLDSFGLHGRNNECGGFYQVSEPAVNMCLPPLQWQTYDIEFSAPKYDASGKKTANARATVKHNGVVIHDDLEFQNGTPGRKGEGPGPRGIHFQGHGNKVNYRNIWVMPKK